MSRIAAALVALCLAAPAQAEVPFSQWSEQRFSLLSGSSWKKGAGQVSVRSDDSVSLIWTALPESAWTARQASWRWSVEQSVAPTALDRKGGDDRNLSLYFVFMPETVARANKGASIRKLLGVKEARVLMYVWGGDHARGDILPTPYLGPRGRTVIRRGAGTGSASEEVDLARDHLQAFGEEPRNLVGIAVSSDSDDTGTQVVARLSDLQLE